MFEDSLGGRERMIVYTKKDLGSKAIGPEDIKVHHFCDCCWKAFA
jgi:hypothetical protein